MDGLLPNELFNHYEKSKWKSTVLKTARDDEMSSQKCRNRRRD